MLQQEIAYTVKPQGIVSLPDDESMWNQRSISAEASYHFAVGAPSL